MFRERPGRLPSDRRVRALDAPGHEAPPDTPPHTDGETLAANLPDRLAPKIPDDRTPFAFFGLRREFLVAHELPHLPTAEGPTPPAWPGISSSGAPRAGDEEAAR